MKSNKVFLHYLAEMDGGLEGIVLPFRSETSMRNFIQEKNIAEDKIIKISDNPIKLSPPVTNNLLIKSLFNYRIENSVYEDAIK